MLGATTPTESSASATRPARIGPGRSPPQPQAAGPASPPRDHTCAIRSGGTLWRWGDNAYGELGIGNQTGQDRPRPVTTPAAGGWASVTAGRDDTCAIRSDGTLWCWGRNETGQLGIGNQNNQNLPRQVTTPAPGGWASVTAGGDYTCATRTGGTLWCWGFGDDGQLGTGVVDAQVLPLQVTTPAPGGWASVTAGGDHTCAIRTNHARRCWGLNNSGQLGLGYYTTGPGVGISIPQQVTSPAAAGWATIAGGGAHTCAIRAAGTLWCWGFNTSGQLGIGNLTYETDLAQRVTGRLPRCQPASRAEQTADPEPWFSRRSAGMGGHQWPPILMHSPKRRPGRNNACPAAPAIPG